jgi:hypothetical protein
VRSPRSPSIRSGWSVRWPSIGWPPASVRGGCAAGCAAC